jgi:hypothetical protein
MTNAKLLCVTSHTLVRSLCIWIDGNYIDYRTLSPIRFLSSVGWSYSRFWTSSNVYGTYYFCICTVVIGRYKLKMHIALLLSVLVIITSVNLIDFCGMCKRVKLTFVLSACYSNHHFILDCTLCVCIPLSPLWGHSDQPRAPSHSTGQPAQELITSVVEPELFVSAPAPTFKKFRLRSRLRLRH